MTRYVLSLAGLLAFLGAIGSQTTPPLKPGKLPKEELAALVSGLTLRFDRDGKTVDVRRSRLAALHVPEGTPPSTLLTPGPFVANFRGYIKTPIRSEYQFQLLARGSAELRINGKSILKAENQTSATTDPVELSRGYNSIEISFTAPNSGDATLRVLWEGEGFNLEPLPPDALFTRGDSVDLVAKSRFRQGRQIFATHGCQRCHSLPEGVEMGVGAMPELQRQAPSLEGAGARFGETWLARWILDPRQLRPQATMPAVLHGDVAPQQAADIAAFLMTLREDASPGPAGTKNGKVGDVKAGEKLFGTLGCLACHHFNDLKEEELFDRLPLRFASEKFVGDALSSFLRAPHRHDAWSRMPDFKLTSTEAENLAAFIRGSAKDAIPPGPKGDAARGKKLFSSAGCASCHVLKTGLAIEDVRRRPFPASATTGCLADAAETRKSAPDFGFTKESREAVLAFLAGETTSLARETPAEFSLRQMADLKCNACHRRDGATSRWFQVMEEEGTLPENLPLLTWAGEKLQPPWTQKLLAGGIDHRARPWLKARMPAFPARADLLSLGLTHEHGFGEKENDRPAPDAELAEVGKKLLPQMGGLNCVQCHGVGATPPVAPFEAPGINLLDAAHRLRYAYYQRWMADPPRVDPTTKMVKLAPDGKTTGLREVFDGDARRQFNALWHFIQTLR